jgi:hypothetical protein
VSITDLGLDLDPNSPTYKDLKLVNGDVATVTGTQGILQNILQTLSIWLGEWFMDNTIGVDYFGTVFAKNPDQRRINALFINQILSVAGVQTLISYSFQADYLTRKLNISFSAQTTQGIVNYSGVL